MGEQIERHPVAIITSDWHLHDWKQFNKDDERIHRNQDLILDIVSKAEELRVPILFAGDMFHTPESLSVKTLDMYMRFFRRLVDNFSFKLYGIPGNHDIYGTSVAGKNPYSSFNAICQAFPTHFENVAYEYLILDDYNLALCGIPYLTYNRDFMKVVNLMGSDLSIPEYQNILLIHTDLHGALDTDGREVGSVENIPRNLGEAFSKFDKVFAGHIHKHMPLWNDKVYMIGAPNQQRRSDGDCSMGYLILYDDGTVVFEVVGSPEFRYYKEGDKIDDYNYWTKIQESKIVKKKKKQDFNPTNDRSSLAKAYIRSEGIKSKRKLNELINVLNKADE